MTRRFKCTACGKCCYGQLPLTWKDALAHATRFPLALVWTPVFQGSKDFKQAAELGVSLKLPDRRELATLIVPTSFIPSSIPCPALKEDNFCGIHEIKPSRCKTMPFYPYRDERFQSDNLILKSNWDCDTSESAPVVYENQKIVMRSDFDYERRDLLDQVPLIRRYAAYMFKYTPTLIGQLAVTASKPQGNFIVTSLSSFLTATRYDNAQNLAQQQLPILQQYASMTVGKPEYTDFYKRYSDWAKEMTFLAQRA